MPNEYDLSLSPVDHDAVVAWGDDAMAPRIRRRTPRPRRVPAIHLRRRGERAILPRRLPRDGALRRRLVDPRAVPRRAALGSSLNTRRPLIDVDGQRFHLTGEITTIGRGTEADIVIEDTGVSRVHARFDVTEFGTILTDLGSTNGTFVEDQRINEVTLLDGNAVTIGRTTIMYWDALPADGGRLT